MKHNITVALIYLLIGLLIAYILCQMPWNALIGLGLALAWVASVFIGFALQVRSQGSATAG